MQSTLVLGVSLSRVGAHKGATRGLPTALTGRGATNLGRAPGPLPLRRTVFSRALSYTLARETASYSSTCIVLWLRTSSDSCVRRVLVSLFEELTPRATVSQLIVLRHAGQGPNLWDRKYNFLGSSASKTTRSRNLSCPGRHPPRFTSQQSFAL